MAEPPFDLAQCHRWFGVELNNLAWELVEAAQRTPDQIETMIHAAHGAYYHWAQVGVAVNRQRAECLLTSAYVTAGRPEAALHHARKCLELSKANGEAQTEFDRATALAGAAQAEAMGGNVAEAQRLKQEALAAAAKISHEDEKKVFADLYDKKWHGA